jgi:hypothetical protein
MKSSDGVIGAAAGYRNLISIDVGGTAISGSCTTARRAWQIRAISAQSYLASVLANRVFNAMSESVTADIERAESLAR